MRSAAVALSVLLFVSAISGQTDGNPQNWCRSGFFTADSRDFRIGTVKGSRIAKSYFYADDAANCPGDANCRQRSYLVGGDQVIVGRTHGGFACSWFSSEKGSETVGWLREDTIQISDPPTKPTLKKWLGLWKYSDNSIEFTENKLPGFLNVGGDAIWKGLGDNVHVGELDGRYEPAGNLIEYSDGEDQYDCKATIRLIGIYLVVADNMHCGGANVSFSGVYRKVKNY